MAWLQRLTNSIRGPRAAPAVCAISGAGAAAHPTDTFPVSSTSVRSPFLRIVMIRYFTSKGRPAGWPFDAQPCNSRASRTLRFYIAQALFQHLRHRSGQILHHGVQYQHRACHSHHEDRWKYRRGNWVRPPRTHRRNQHTKKQLLPIRRMDALGFSAMGFIRTHSFSTDP